MWLNVDITLDGLQQKHALGREVVETDILVWNRGK